MGRIRDAFRRAGEWTVGESGAEAIGKFLTAILIVVIIAVILAIVYIGAASGIAAVHEEDVGARLRLLILLVLGSVAVAAAIAVVPPLIRSLWEQVGWWTNMFRFLALLVIVFAVVVSAPLVLPQLPGGRWFAWLERAEPDATEGEPVGLIPDTPHALTPDIAAIRRETILRQYWRFLAHYGDEDLMRRYDRVTQWRSLTEKYAIPAKLDVTRVEAVMMAESAGQPENMSGAGAMGLMQLMPSNIVGHGPVCGVTSMTAEAFRRHPKICREALSADGHRIEMGLLDFDQRRICGEAFDPERNVCGGVDELRELSNTFPGDWDNVLAAYNWGIGNLGHAFDRLQRIAPKEPRSFWSLWDKVDATTGEQLLYNTGEDPNQTRYYVPSVIAWEYLIRYIDEHGRPPPRNGDREPPRVARRDPTSRRSDGADNEWVDAAVAWAVPPESQPERSVPTSNVWYTVQRGEGIGDVLLLFREPTETIVALNADVVAERDVAAGARVRLPEDRYAFYRANGSESYRDIAAHHGMSVAELLRWTGRWTAEQALLAKYRDCPPEGCADELAVASAGEQLLVRRQN